MTPAASICQPVATSGSTATFQRRDSTEPNAQQNDEPSSATQATSCIQPSCSARGHLRPEQDGHADGAERDAADGRPRRPVVRRQEPPLDQQEPDRDDGDDERGEARSGRTAPTRRAPTFDTPSRMKPTMASSASCRRLTRTRRPVSAQKASISEPEIVNLTPARKIGGTRSTATRIPR